MRAEPEEGTKMARKMSTEEIEKLLSSEVVARIGCHSDGRTYVVPIAYAYGDGTIWGFSHEGMKIRMMRQNPQVCLEIDRVHHLGSWKSVIAWGRFEELEGEDAKNGADRIGQRLASLAADPESRRRLEEALGAGPQPIVYRIIIEEQTGRIEGPG